MSRIYVGGANGNFGWVDSDTKVYTAMPSVGISAYVNAIVVFSETNIWVGLAGYPPTFANWDGISWTTYQIAGSAADSDPAWSGIRTLIAVSETEMYASTGRDAYIHRWNGSAWSDYFSISDSDWPLIYPGSVETDMWIGYQPGAANIAHWNGSTVDFKELAGASAIVGLRLVGGELHALSYQEEKIIKRIGADNWVELADAGGVELGHAGRDSAWHDEINDHLWASWRQGSNNYGAVKWDGTSLSSYIIDSGNQPFSIMSMTGVVSGGDATVWTAHDNSALSYRDPGTGNWGSVSLSFVPRSLLAEDPAIAPAVKNQSPAPGSSGNSADTPVYLEVDDDDGDLDASAVNIYIDGTLAWSSDATQQPGFSAYKSPITNGYAYTIQPWAVFAAGSHDIRVVASDTGGTTTDETYPFSTDAPLTECTRVQWGDVQWGDVQWGDYNLCLPTLDLITPSIVSTIGGETMVATGIFSVSQIFFVHMGPLGTVEDPLCYGGLGLGYEAISEDGTTLVFFTPPMAKGTVYVTVTDGVTTLVSSAVSVLERNWPGKLHGSRRLHPPWLALGGRLLGQEDEQ